MLLTLFRVAKSCVKLSVCCKVMCQVVCVLPSALSCVLPNVLCHVCCVIWCVTLLVVCKVVCQVVDIVSRFSNVSSCSCVASALSYVRCSFNLMGHVVRICKVARQVVDILCSRMCRVARVLPTALSSVLCCLIGWVTLFVVCKVVRQVVNTMSWFSNVSRCSRFAKSYVYCHGSLMCQVARVLWSALSCVLQEILAIVMILTFARESPTFQTGFHVSKRSPRHPKEWAGKPSNLEI